MMDRLGERLRMDAMATFELASNGPDPQAPVRFAYVVGMSVFVSDEPADPTWPRHFVGVLDGMAVFAVDVPEGIDPSDEQAAVDLRRLHGMTDEVSWAAAARGVQLVEWARTHRFCGRCGAPDRALGTVHIDGLSACGLNAFPRGRPGDDHARHGQAVTTDPTRKRCWHEVCSGRSRCTRASPASSRPARHSSSASCARSARRWASPSATCATSAASPGRSRTA